MKAQEIKNTLESKAAEFGMSNAEVADRFDTGIINIHNNSSDSDKLKKQIVDLFTNQLGVNADEDTIIEAATLFVKEHSNLSSHLN